MKIKTLHRWDVSSREAVRIQKDLRSRLDLRSRSHNIRHVAGADIAITPSGREGIALVVIFSFPDLEIVEQNWVKAPLRFPYIPGLLSFRESPLLLEAFAKTRTEPDVIFIDGQGTAHPRGFGIACHIGFLLDKMTIGCAKSRLIGTFEEPGPAAGRWSRLIHEGRVVGAALTTRERTSPIFVSPGHRINLKTAIRLVMACTDGYRIPKPTRIADHLVGKLKRGEDTSHLLN